MDNKLPPLPGSDPDSLKRNEYNSYYDVRSADFWKGNQITRIEDTDMPKHEHKFKSAPGGAKCTVCNFGLLGQLEVQSGKLFYKGEPIEL